MSLREKGKRRETSFALRFFGFSLWVGNAKNAFFVRARLLDVRSIVRSDGFVLK